MQQLVAHLPEYAEGLFQPVRYKVYWGGRGAARSWSFARAILIKGSQKKIRVLCVREFQKSIADSVHRLLVDQIGLLKLPGWVVTKTAIVHQGTGTEILFEGLRYNTNRIKSLEGIDICWVEEAESVSKDSWEILIPTIRKEGSEIWISFNPDLEDDPTYQRFVVHHPPNAIVQKVGWEDNPWFPDTLKEEKDYLYSVDPEAAEHVWGGNTRKTSEAQILHGKYRIEAFEPRDDWKGPFYGADYGFAEDPCALIKMFIQLNRRDTRSQGKLYIQKEAWKVRLDIHKIIPFWTSIMGSHVTKNKIFADSARPETTSYLKQHGMANITSVFKWPGSIEDGIGYLRGFEEIIIHPDCPHAKEEARLWSYKIDQKTGEVLAEVSDKHNHLMDSARYGLSKFIRMKRPHRSNYSGTSYANRN